MISERLSGVLLHVTSLPSYGGIGDFGPAAYQFLDFLVAAKQRLWQVLPLNPVGYGNSPYSAISAFAGNPLLISLERLQQDGWLYIGESNGLAGTHGPVDFERALMEKLPLIERAAVRFLKNRSEKQHEAFEAFCQRSRNWLLDYARYSVLRRRFGYRLWTEWPAEFASHDEKALKQFDEENRQALEIEYVIQFFFMQQWERLRSFANSRDIRIMGDMAIFVSYDSADVWANRELFDLDENYKPIAVSGVPPDYFSVTGQRWGNPLYRWDYLEKNGFQWWIARVKRQMELYDLLRLDHFRGFEAYWRIPAEEETAIHGEWVEAPGHALFECLKEALGGSLPFIAEDLGVITDKVDKLRTDFNMPGMRVLQFGFADRGAHVHLPHRYDHNTICYTGTHDNNTTLGWWHYAGDAEKRNLLSYLGPLPHPHDCVWAMIRCAERSVAAICIVPMQDLLHLGSEGRMNTPGAPENNWAWRYASEQLHADISRQFGEITQECDRDAYVAEEVLEVTEIPPQPEALQGQSA